jgi:hypothetical protein
MQWPFAAWGATAVLAQAETPDAPPPRLVITGSDAASPPTITLHAYGIDSQGNAVNFGDGSVILMENNVPLDYQVAGQEQVGTLTVFLLDIPGGVSEQLPAIQDAILQYASAGNMMEGVDYVAIYQIGETGPVELLAPESFHNGVQNLFLTGPLTPETGATALIDSTMDMLNQLESLKPNPLMAASLVVMSDGTDVVSSRFTTGDVAPHAANLGFPIHTIWLDNAELPGLSIGRDYLAQLAAGSRGTAVQLANGDLSAIWNQINNLRSHAQLRYRMDDPVGGTLEISLSMADNPQAQATTTVEVSTTAPSVTIDLPLESRILSLPNLDKPVKLRFAATVTWLDGVERQLEAAQLVVNGTVIQDIPVKDINEFVGEIDNFVYGENRVQVAILDEQGFPVTSPPVNLTVNEGGRDIPEALDAGGGLSNVLPTLIFVVFGIALLLAAVYLVRRYDLPDRVKRPSRRQKGVGDTAVGQAVATYEEPYHTPTETAGAPVITSSEPFAYLEVLDSVTRMPDSLPLTTSQVRLGRSPAQSDIPFENDITVSRLHATLQLEGSHFRILDERSTSGTWVNEQQVPEYGIQLMDGDEIHLGAVHLRYREG